MVIFSAPPVGREPTVTILAMSRDETKFTARSSQPNASDDSPYFRVKNGRKKVLKTG